MGATIQVYNNVTDGLWMFMKEISSDGDISIVITLLNLSSFYKPY